MAEIRAAQLQENLVALAVLGDEVAERVLADVPAEVLARIREATRVAWLPVVEVNEPLLRAIRARAGDEGLRDFARAAALRSATSRLFGPIVEPLVRMFGLKPGVLLRVPPLAYRATFRNMGELSVVSSAPHRVLFALRHLPPQVERDQFLLVMAGAIESALAHAQVIGRVDLLAGAGDADACFQARWPVERPITARPFTGVTDAELAAQAAATERTRRPTQVRG
jgi:hypothetical protein